MRAEIIEVRPGFYVRVSIDNMAWVDMGDWVLVVDAVEQPELADEVFAAILATVGDKPVRYLLNTHTHYDHVGLNDAFVARFGCEIVNRDVAPLPEAGRWFGEGKRRSCMLPMGPLHSHADCVVWWPGDSVLIVGDLYALGMIPLVINLRDDSARLLVETYDRLTAFGAAVVVPGHGKLIDTAWLRRWLGYFGQLCKDVGAACDAGWSDDRIMAEIARPEDMKAQTDFEDCRHRYNLTRVIKGIRRRWLDPARLPTTIGDQTPVRTCPRGPDKS